MAKTIYTEEYKIFQKLLKKAREDAGLTQVDVADALKTPQSFISKVEAGDRRIDVIEFWNLAKLYKKPVEFFFKFEDKAEHKSKKKSLKAASSTKRKSK
ncbi:helix-turn-helix domain-containing protein [Leptospira licerasiae]|uniref:DNA-binding helix-turn-helix protein n=1 Tax=Leptospira licerasiae str. MMD4847 TaxID=1049971 RepID=A0ABN0H6A0_9LEPT|nr:helix-turn-helix transcriptional regulator [Leptospira licerasiae]EIE02379.1 DNA-binding helix-turn-helix protein [Leptospira licerasiae serovar Varillal str. VAR 010]EJZ41001.1 DNA-binding helix-turn-helix protein [Leptospira licerasiae str. MMD4847]TGM90010.1 XRE family transcriptional regulator [Leptospira licerasiae]